MFQKRGFLRTDADVVGEPGNEAVGDVGGAQRLPQPGIALPAGVKEGGVGLHHAVLALAQQEGAGENLGNSLEFFFWLFHI